MDPLPLAAAAAGRRAAAALFFLLAASGCSSDRSPSGPGPAVTPTPTPGGPSGTEFTLTVTPDPVRFSTAGYNSPGSAWVWLAHPTVTIAAPRDRGGSWLRLDLILRDAGSGQVLGSRAQTGYSTPLEYPGGAFSPGLGLLTDLGFNGAPARLEVRAEIADSAGPTRTLKVTVGCESLPAPRLLSVLSGVVHQNDPGTGCHFDSLHGWGTSGEFSWEAIAARFAGVRYRLWVLDGTGGLVSSAEVDASPARAVGCNTSVGDEQRPGAWWGVQAFADGWVSPIAWKPLEIEPCRPAGVPICQ